MPFCPSLAWSQAQAAICWTLPSSPLPSFSLKRSALSPLCATDSWTILRARSTADEAASATPSAEWSWCARRREISATWSSRRAYLRRVGGESGGEPGNCFVTRSACRRS